MSLKSAVSRGLPTTTTKLKVKSFDQIPGPKPLPLIGNVWRYFPIVGNYKIDTLYENALYNKNRYGPIVREQITTDHTILHLFDPKDIEALFRQETKYPHRRSHRALLKYRLDRPDQYTDGGLFPENGPRWHRQRHQFQLRLMSKSQVALNIPKLDSVATSMIQELQTAFHQDNNTTVIPDFNNILNRWALANTLSTFLDISIQDLDKQLVDDIMERLNDSLHAIDGTEIKTERWIKSPNKCPYFSKLVSSQDFLYDFVRQHVDKSIANPNMKSHSYIRLWTDIDKIDRKDIVAFIMDLLLAGLHTSSYIFAFLLYNISTNSKVKIKLQREFHDIFKGNRSIDLMLIDESTYLRDCIKETLRLNPVSIGTGRYTSQDGLVINGYSIPKDIMIIAQTQAISRDANIFENPTDFKPERWSHYRTLDRDQRPSSFASLTFGFGPRICIGQKLFEVQVKILALRLLSKFDLDFKEPIKTKTTLIHNIDEDIKVTMKKL